ncbi:MAG: DNRLRE domain-containing protein [Clostridia bacterium]|nr:DNRLRE domain-containing protein [Clostridia bacterium]
MKKVLLLLLVGIMLLQAACAAAPAEKVTTGTVLSNDDVVKTAAEDVKTVYTSEYAYVRGGGEWKDKNWHDILAERGRAPMLILKNGLSGTNVTRLALLKFDLSELKAEDVGSVMLAVKFTDIQKDVDVPFAVYMVSSEWEESKVTYSTQPKKTNGSPIDSGVVFEKGMANVTSAVLSALKNGEKQVSFLLVQEVDTETETKIEFSKLKDGEMPKLVVSDEPSDKPTELPKGGTTEKEEQAVRRFYTTEYAYVRGGSKFANKDWHTINSENNLDENLLYLKNGLQTGDVARRAFFRFDISGLDVRDVGYAELCFKFSAIESSKEVHFDVYLVDDNWDGDTVTWNTQPKKLNESPVIFNAVFGILAKVDATEFIEDMIFDGKTKFSLMLVQVDETDVVTKISVGKSAGSALPHFKVYADKSAGETTYVKQLVEDETENKAIWDRAKQMYDEWYARYLVMKEKPLSNPTLIESDKSEFGLTVMSPGSNPAGSMIARATRTVDQLKGFFEKETELDVYGGLVDNSLRQEVTGFFYTKKIGDRWWVIDPLGYPVVLRCVSGVTVAYQGAPTQKAAVLSKYGNSERWAISVTRHLKDDLGFNCHSTSDDEIYGVVDGLAYFKRFGAMSSYASAQGINAGQGGQAKFSENNTMPVFDPGFEVRVEQNAKSNAVPDDKNMIAYITDNELPMGLTMLRDYLTVDPYKEVNRYSYATAWYWVTQMTGKENVTDADITEELMDIFRGFVWDRYYYVVTTAIEKYDPNHLYAGTKYLNGVKESEWVIRVSAEYVDILTINWYGAWEPQAEFIYDFAKYADTPFMVTEFYAKSSQTFDNLACKDGAGFFVKTQADRGLFYQNYTLRLLEAKNCVGWQWFQYTDNDPAGNPTDISSRDANKGIVNNRHEEYTELTDDMTVINKNVYNLIEYFDNK